jgi:hypothetical protein
MKLVNYLLLFFLFSGKVFSQNPICFKGVEDYSFVQNFNSGTVNNVKQSVIADYNNDGIKDVILGVGSSLLFYSGTNTGTFAPSTLFTNSAFTISVNKLLNGDYNNDGKMDVAICGAFSSSGPARVQILYGNGAGSFTCGNTYTAPLIPQYSNINSFKQGDINNDGFIDFLITFNTAPSVWTATNNATGSLGITNALTNNGMGDLMDFDNDGNLDIISGNSMNKGNGNGTFIQSSINTFGPSTWLGEFSLQDIDGNGTKDIIYLNTDPSKIRYRYNNGNGSFSTEYSINCDFPLNGFKATDINGDGLKEIIGYSDYLSSIRIFKNNGYNVFTFAASILVVTGYYGSYSVADINSDGKTDIIFPGYDNDRFCSILGNSNLSYPSNNIVKHQNVAYSSGITVNDFNNDGKPDFASAGLGEINIAKGLPGGGSTNVNSGPFTGNIKGKVYSEDFNNDGFTDVLSINNLSGNSNNFNIYEGNGTCSLTNQYFFWNNSNSPSAYQDLEIADFDNDGYKDIATANTSIWGYNVLKGSANFSFTTTYSISLTSASNDIVSGDFNNDGNLDIVTVNSASKLNVMLGNGNCTFQAPITITLTGVGANLLTKGNFNGDGNLDLFISGNNQMYSLFGMGTGSFVVNQTVTISSLNTDILTADFNNDGKDEVVISKSGSFNNLNLLVFNASNQFLQYKYTVGTNPNQMVAYDVNGDGAKDLVVSGGQFIDQDTRILYNAGAISNNISNTYSLCTGGSVIITIPNNYNIQWSNGGNTNTQIFNTPGNYSVVSSNFAGSCSSSFTFQVVTSTNAATPLSITNSNTLLCSNSAPVQLTSSPTTTTFYGPAVTQTLFCATQGTVGVNKVYASYTNTNQCTSVDSILFTLNLSPVVFGGFDTTICYKGVIALTGTGTATSYTWSNSIQNNVPFVASNISSGGNYYVVTGTGSLGCTSKDSVYIQVDPSCAIVWPGDVDENGVVNTNDFLTLGIAYGYSLPARTSTSNVWAPWPSVGAIYPIPSTNYTVCFTDCDGSGVVDLNDTLAINLNFAQTHLVKPLNNSNSTATANLYLQFNKPIYNSNDTIIADIYLGNPSSQINNFYGTSFYMNYDHSKFKSNGVSVEFNNSWIGVNNVSKINFKHIDQAIGRVDFSIVKITHNDTIGDGKICTVKAILRDSLKVTSTIFELKDAIKMNKIGVISNLISRTDTIAINASDIGLTQNTRNIFLKIAPNPSSGYVKLLSSEIISSIEVIDALGRKKMEVFVGRKGHTLNLDELSRGVYILKTITQDGRSRHDRIILEKD